MLRPGREERGRHTTQGAGATVETFVKQVKAIPGAKGTPGQLDAATFEPSVVPAAKDALIDALEALVQTVQGA